MLTPLSRPVSPDQGLNNTTYIFLQKSRVHQQTKPDNERGHTFGTTIGPVTYWLMHLIFFALRRALMGIVKEYAAHGLLSHCCVCCGSPNFTAKWVTSYLKEPSAILAVDELQRQAVARRCNKRPSRLRNWRFCTNPTFTLLNRIWTSYNSS